MLNKHNDNLPGLFIQICMVSWCLIVRNIKPVFDCIVLLVRDDQLYEVSCFATENFSFVTRKV